MRPPTTLRSLTLSGCWFGLSWAAAESAVHAPGPTWPRSVFAVEALLALAVFGGLAAGLALLLRRREASGGTHSRYLLAAGTAVVANLLIHPYLLAGVTILTMEGFLHAVGFTLGFLVPALAAGRIPLLRSDRRAPPLFWIAAALLLGGVFVIGRVELVNLPAGYGRVFAAWGLFVAAEILLLAVLARLGSGRLVGAIPAAAAIVLVAYPIPRLLDRPPALQPPTAPQTATPVILISLDTLRPDHLSFFGYGEPTSPNLDAFLEQCRVFPEAYATSPWTLPSHASVFTGHYAVTHGAHFPENHPTGTPPGSLRPDLPTLAEIFRDRGYRTAAISANRLAVSPEFGLDRGFEILHADLRAGSRPMPVNLLKSISRLTSMTWLKRFARQHWDAAEVTDLAAGFLDDHDREPFFLFLNYIDPHRPYAPPEPLHPDRVRGMDRVRWLFASPPKRSMDGVPYYDGEIRYMDRHLGRLFHDLEARGLLDRALVVVFTDHGEYFGEMGLFGHGRDVHEAVLRALVAVRYPEGRHAGIDSTLVNLADIPRLIGTAEDGVDPEDVLLGRDDPWVAGEKYHSAGQAGRHPRFDHPMRLVAARWGSFKLVRADQEAALFDLRIDPGETVDLSGSDPARLGIMMEALKTWETSQSKPAAPHLARKDALDVLRGLGYVQ